MSGDHDNYYATAEVVKDGGVYLTLEETQEFIGALEEALYLLNPTKEDIEKRTGVYRVMTAKWKLKEKNRSSASNRDWAGLTKDDINEMIVDVWLKRNRYAESDELRWFVGLIEDKLKEKNSESSY